MSDSREKKAKPKTYRFVPDGLVPIYEHNLREIERLRKYLGAGPDWKTVPFDEEKLKEEQERIIAQVKRPSQAASAG